MMGAKPLSALIADGTAQVEGKTKILEQFAAIVVAFEPRFEILPGTRGPDTSQGLNEFEYGPLDTVRRTTPRLRSRNPLTGASS